MYHVCEEFFIYTEANSHKTLLTNSSYLRFNTKTISITIYDHTSV